MSTPVPTLPDLFTVSSLLPVTVLTAMIVVVTIVALCRADKKDVPQIFASFAAAYGFRKSQSRDDLSGTSRGIDEAQSTRPLEGEEKA
ncbi:hypothetical protein [Nocardia violaceofusca]|uniref:hypothetical protein n=1 Tax=Nocardia violaceofusca TaxID=941182 RepID=UPI000ABAB832|nr:hypothetical protein [Nocardia violaceofusca]